MTIQINIGEIGQILATLVVGFNIWRAHYEMKKEMADLRKYSDDRFLKMDERWLGLEREMIQIKTEIKDIISRGDTKEITQIKAKRGPKPKIKEIAKEMADE